MRERGTQRVAAEAAHDKALALLCEVIAAVREDPDRRVDESALLRELIALLASGDHHA